ncbi:MAG: hypothetical protein QM831_13405 [Kofleriaceae bacterium]
MTQIPTLDDDLEEREAADYAAILREPAESANTALARTWQAILDRRDPIEILGHAILWCSRPVIAGAVGECVHLILDRVPNKHRAPMIALLDTLERHARGDASLLDVWEAKSQAKFHLEDVTEAFVDAADAAGDNVRGFDDEALVYAGRAVTAVLEIGGEIMRDRIVEILRQRITPPTVSAFHDAYAERYR